MSPAQIVLLVVVMAAAAFVVARLTTSNAPKRFGLKEAEAAAQYVGTADAARPVLGVVVGVLGYQNAVAEDLATETGTATRLDEVDRDEIAGDTEKVADLQREIARLRGLIDNREVELAEKVRIAALFA